jgi:hypothetical protein
VKAEEQLFISSLHNSNKRAKLNLLIGGVMGVKALLTIDFEDGVTSIQRNVFNLELEELQWIKIPEMHNDWEVSFNDLISRSFALNTVKADVAKAARKAKITKYQVAIQFGQEWPVRFAEQKARQK